MNAQRERSGKRVGYIRVSTIVQNTSRQLDGIEVDRLFTDHASGKDRNRPQLTAAMQYLREGDLLIVHSMDRLARNTRDLMAMVDELTGRQVHVQFVKENLTFTGDDSPIANLMLGIMAAMAQFERCLILERQREGIELARRAGKYKGRKPVLKQEDYDLVLGKVIAGVSKARIAREMGVSRQTLYAFLEEGRKHVRGEKVGEGVAQ